MNAQVQRHPSEFGDSLPRSSARPATTAPDVQPSPSAAEDRPAPTGNAQRVDPLWMITVAAAVLFAFLVAATSSI